MIKYISVYDREAIANALKSTGKKILSDNLIKFSKAFSVTSTVIDGYDILMELVNYFITKNWRPFILKVESIGIGKLALVLVAFAFSTITTASLGILAYSFLMAVVGSMIDEEFTDKINKSLGF